MTIDESSQSVLLEVQGRLDFQGCKVLHQRLVELEAHCFKLWILDLAQVDFMGSVGVESLVKAVKLAAKKNCRLAICHPHPAVQIVFDMTRLDQVLECLEPEAVNALAPRRSHLPLRVLQAIA